MELIDPDDPGFHPQHRFVDRISEAQVMRKALEQHEERVRAGHVDTRALKNVLTFYGDAGYGKSELSTRLEAEIRSEEGAPPTWREVSYGPVDAVVRWDLNDSRGNVDPLSLLIALRSQLADIKREWPPFDLAFGALYRTLRPGEDLHFQSAKAGSAAFSDVLAGLLGDFAAAAGIAVSGALGAGLVSLGRSVLSSARRSVRGNKILEAYPRLDSLLVECEKALDSPEEISKLAGRVAFMLTRELASMPPSDRPIVVVFVDQMERVQVPGERHLGEAVLNRLVARLPYFLFVITGKEYLRWYEVNPELPASGRDMWPLLSPDSSPEFEPRQHRIGRLPDSYAEAFLRSSLNELNVEVAPGSVEELAYASGGWPLHLRMIVGLARERADLGRPLTLEDLGGPIEHLVERLLTDFPDDQADALRAACLLPYFDVPLVAAAGEIRAGAVQRLVSHEVVLSNEGSPYPYRIHDTVRALVRSAGTKVPGAWGEADWKRHSALALDESMRRFDEAMAAGDDVGAVHSLALGLNLATENNVFDPWLVQAIRRSPTVRGLASLISAYPSTGAPADLRDILDFLHLRSRAIVDDVTDRMREICQRRTAISSTAGLWRAYDLRARGRIGAAIDQFEELLREFGDRSELYQNQICVTLRMNRQFQEVMERLNDLPSTRQEEHRAALRRVHGTFAGSSEFHEERSRRAYSRRFQIELAGTAVVFRNREYGVTEDEIRKVLTAARESGHQGAQANCVATLASLYLFRPDRFAECIEELEELSARRFQPYAALPEVLALRAWALSDETLAERAREIARRAEWRSVNWIPCEVLLQAMDRPLDPVETQWLEPYGVVSERWLGIFGGIIDRARQNVARS